MAKRTGLPKLHAERVKLDRGGYVKSGQAHAGRYFGVGEKLWRVTDEHGEVDCYVRSSTMREAKLSCIDEAFRALRKHSQEGPADKEDPTGVINVEALDDIELAQLASSRTGDPRYREIAKLYKQSRPLRAKGRIADALRIELQAQMLYDKLPSYMRW
jgi:hypothetical protein